MRKVPINGGDVITLSTNGFERTLAINDTHVFFSYVIQQWSDEIPAVYIAKINKQGGNVIVLASHSTIRSYPSKITVDDSFVYWVETAGTIDKVSINGGMITNIAAGLNDPQQIVVDANSVYWTEYAKGKPGAGAIKKIPISGGEVTTLASGLNGPFDITIKDTYIYWTEQGTNGKDVSIKKTWSPPGQACGNNRHRRAEARFAEVRPGS